MKAGPGGRPFRSPSAAARNTGGCRREPCTPVTAPWVRPEPVGRDVLAVRHDEGDERPFTRGALGDRHIALLHRGIGSQVMGHFPEFDTVSADLHLVVLTPLENQIPVVAEIRAVTGAVEASGNPATSRSTNRSRVMSGIPRYPGDQAGARPDSTSPVSTWCAHTCRRPPHTGGCSV